MEELNKKIERYFEITKKALAKAKESPENLNIKTNMRAEFVEMVEGYVSDAEHFRKIGKLLEAFASLNYAHGWLDAGARIGLFDVHDSKLFAND